MLTENGIKLAVHIITTDFGKLVSQVCECLLRRGSLTISGIGRFTELPSEKVKRSLLVLIRHNCVHAFALEQESDHGESTSGITHYEALFDNIIQRIRFPKFLAIVSNELDKKCAELFEGLLQHGRLALAQILDMAAEEADEGSDADPNAVQERFFRLVNSRYVKHCHAAELFIGLPADNDDPPKRREPESSKIQYKEVILEERALADAIPAKQESCAINSVSQTDTEAEMNRNNIPIAKTGEKRKLKLADMEPEFDLVGCEKESVWRVNLDEFEHLLRNKACIDTIRARLDDKAGIVLSAMLKASRSTESTVSLSVGAIFEELLRSNQTLTMTIDNVRSIMDGIGCDSVTDDVYCIDLRKIIEQAQNEEIESIVLKRYGREAYRMFRLLTTDGRALETDQISDRTFVEKKATEKILYQLWKDNFILMENVRRGSTKDHLLWNANKDALFYEVLDELYRAVLNLRLRFNHEVDLRRELMQMGKSKLDGELLTRFQHLQQTTSLLVNCIQKLDDALLLFQASP
ncbi:hypothetical protein Dimus_000264 [Dionaea muscipula]